MIKNKKKGNKRKTRMKAYQKYSVMLFILSQSFAVWGEDKSAYIAKVKAQAMTPEEIGEINARARVICRQQSDYLPKISKQAQALFEKGRALEKQKKLTEAEQLAITEYYTAAAKAGHWKAWHNLSVRALKGIGMEKNAAMAVEIYHQMIERDIPIGYYNMAVALRYGTGVRRDELGYLQHLYKAAELGNPEAQFWLGQIWSTRGQSVAKGIQYHQCALAQGYARSAYEIGSIYESGAENYPKAAYYYREYGALGYSMGLTSLESILSEKRYGYNLQEDSPLMIKINRYWEELGKKEEGTPMPEIRKEIKIPKHKYMGYGEDIPDEINTSVLKRMIKAKELGVHWQEKFSVKDVKL